MNIQRGMHGDLVAGIQQRLKDLGLLSGGVDGAFGGGTEAAVKTFQLKQGAQATGIVDAATWGKLFPGVAPPESPLAHASLNQKCLALTGAFETGRQPPDCFCGITGNFDGQGISFGVLQWNIGQQSLQPLLAQMIGDHPQVCQSIFHEHLDTIRTLGGESAEEQLKFACSIQTPKGDVVEPWRGMLVSLGRTNEFQAIQASHASKLLDNSIALCGAYGLRSERAVALMFDIQTQNGSIKPLVKTQILADFKQVTASAPDDVEVARMRIIANRVAASARAQFVDDVRVRKLTIAEGKGTVHGIPYDLENVYCLTLAPFASSNAASTSGD